MQAVFRTYPGATSALPTIRTLSTTKRTAAFELLTGVHSIQAALLTNHRKLQGLYAVPEVSTENFRKQRPILIS